MRTAERARAARGLAIVSHLVERHGVRVGAESPDGVTRVWFSLPD